MNCKETQNQLLGMDTTDDTLPTEASKHVQQCAVCQAFKTDLSDMQSHLNEGDTYDVSDEVFAATLQAVQHSSPTAKHRINPQWATGLAASFVLVAVAGLIYNGSINEFQADFNQFPATSEAVSELQSKSELAVREKRQLAESEASDEATESVSVDVVYLEDLDMETQVRARRMPSKTAPVVENTLGEIMADQMAPLEAPEPMNEAFAQLEFDDAKTAADRMEQQFQKEDLMVSFDDVQNQPSDKGNITVTGSRIRRSDVEVAAQPRVNDADMSLDQLLKTVQKSAVEDSAENITREAEFKKQQPKAISEKVYQQYRNNDSNAGLAAGEKNKTAAWKDKLGGSLNRSAGGGMSTDASDEAALAYLAKLQNTESLLFKSATGYWQNTYVPGDPNMRWIEANLLQAGEINTPAVQQNAQPFDAPDKAALAFYLSSDHSFASASEPTRMRLQVGIQAGNHQGGHRSAMHLAVVLDLAATEDQDQVAALLSALLKAKLPADQIALFVVGTEGGMVIAAEDFKHGHIQVALQQIFAAKPDQQNTTSTPATMAHAYEWLRSEDDPQALLGSSALWLVSTGDAQRDWPMIEAVAQQQATTGISTSTLALGNGDQRQTLQRVALFGQGHSRIMLGVHDAQRVVKDELKAASRAVARAVRLQIKLAAGVQLIDVLGSHSLSEQQAQQVRDAEQSLDLRMAENLGIQADRGADDDGIQIIIPNFYAGDTHVILLDVLVKQAGAVAEFSAKYKDLVFLRNASSQQQFVLSQEPKALGPAAVNVVKNVLTYHFTQSMDAASNLIKSGNKEQAMTTLETMLRTLQQLPNHIQALQQDTEIQQDIQVLKYYLNILHDLQAFQADKYQLIADSMRYVSWQKLLSHSP